MSNPQVGHVKNWHSTHRTYLLQHFQYMTPEEDDKNDDEPTSLAAIDLGMEEGGY